MDIRQICRNRNIFYSKGEDRLSLFILGDGRSDLLASLHAAMAPFLRRLFISAAVNSIAIIGKPFGNHVRNGHDSRLQCAGTQVGIHRRLQTDIHDCLSIVQIIDTLTLSGRDLGNCFSDLRFIGHQIKTVAIISDRVVSSYVATIFPFCLDIVRGRPVGKGSRGHDSSLVLPIQNGRYFSFVLLGCSHIYIRSFHCLTHFSSHGTVFCSLKE